MNRLFPATIVLAHHWIKQPFRKGAMDHKVSFTDALDGLTEFWSQEVLAEANGTLIKVAKGTGSTRWHSHDDQDETFILLEGELTVRLRDRNVVLLAGDLFVVPLGVEHCPMTNSEARFIILGTSVTSNAAGGKPDWSVGGGAPSKET